MHWRGGLNIRPGSPESGRSGEAIGWAALSVDLTPSIIASGRVDVDDIEISPVRLNGAEYKLLRLDCGLSQNEAATVHGVKLRTIKAWESENSMPGEEACTRLAALRASMDVAANKTLDIYREQTRAQGCEPELVDLYIYSGDNYPSSHAYAEGLPHGAHTRLVAITAELLAAYGITVTVRYASISKDDFL